MGDDNYWNAVLEDLRSRREEQLTYGRLPVFERVCHVVLADLERSWRVLRNLPADI
jgi:hypothetical protein